MKKQTRVAPNIFNNTISPSADIPLLEFYKDYYDCVFIILHPFYKIVHPQKIDFAPQWPAEIKWPSKKDITAYTKGLSWMDFMELSGIPNVKRLDIALRNSILGLNKNHKNEQDLLLLQTANQQHNLIQPQEGNLSDLLIDDMLKVLLSLNHQWIFVGDEFGHERKLVYIEDIIDNTVEINFHHENWYTPKNEILFTTHWDSHFTMLCSDKKTIETILEIHPFEGFYCDNNTKVYWSLQ